MNFIRATIDLPLSSLPPPFSLLFSPPPSLLLSHSFSLSSILSFSSPLLSFLLSSFYSSFLIGEDDSDEEDYGNILIVELHKGEDPLGLHLTHYTSPEGK